MPSRLLFVWCSIIIAIAVCGCQRDGAATLPAAPYVVAVSERTAKDPAWAQVVAELCARHQAREVRYAGAIENCQPALRAIQPRYVAFVARPEETGLEYVRQIHLLSRRMDDDPYVDFTWGIITGATAADARRLAAECAPLVVRTALNTTGVRSELLDGCLTLSDGAKGDWYLKDAAGEHRGNVGKTQVPQRATPIVTMFSDYWSTRPVDLLVTSSHATPVNLEMPFGQGALALADGRLYPLQEPAWGDYLRQCRADSEDWFCRPTCSAVRSRWLGGSTATPLAESARPKVLVAAGNCLMGDTMGSANSQAIAWLTHYGVRQLVGYTVTTWFGRMGWGTNARWQDSGGQLDLAESFVLNNQCIIQALVAADPALAALTPDAATIEQLAPLAWSGRVEHPTAGLVAVEAALTTVGDPQRRKELIGLLHDRDTVAFFGDPSWAARFDRAKHAEQVTWSWSQDERKRDVLTLTSAKGWKSAEGLALFLPRRLAGATVSAADGLGVVLADDCLLVPGIALEAGKPYRIVIAPAAG
jgi:zinc protease